VALMLLSGGTTGLPKLIPRTHDDYIYNAGQAAREMGFSADTRCLFLLPLAHNYNLAAPGFLGAMSQGATVILSDDTSAGIVFPLIERERVSHVGAALPLIAQWLEAPEVAGCDLGSLKTITNGGARLPQLMRRGVEEKFGCTFIESYGTSEGLICQTGSDDPEAIRFESSGRPISPADEIKIVDEAGVELPDGEVGELLVRGPYTIRGYYRNPEADAAAFTKDGFYRMGDAVWKQGGYLHTQGRRTDIVNRGGEKISCAEVESHIIAHPSVQSACLVAMPDPVYGEKACACVIVGGGGELTFDDLVSFLLSRDIAKFKLPERLEVVNEFPLSPAGKVLRRELQSRIEG
jgi:2,3-dihydroxybenzoate-AMP ligase